MRRVAAITTKIQLSFAPVVSGALRYVKSSDPTYEDGRWLEAQLDDPEKTVEERYAHEKEHAVMRKILEKMQQEQQTKTEARIEEIVKQHKEDSRAQLDALNAEIAKLGKRLETVQHQKRKD